MFVTTSDNDGQSTGNSVVLNRALWQCFESCAETTEGGGVCGSSAVWLWFGFGIGLALKRLVGMKYAGRLVSARNAYEKQGWIRNSEDPEEQ